MTHALHMRVYAFYPTYMTTIECRTANEAKDHYADQASRPDVRCVVLYIKGECVATMRRGTDGIVSDASTDKLQLRHGTEILR